MNRLTLARAAAAGGLLAALAVGTAAQQPAAKSEVPTGPAALQVVKINEYIQKGYESAGIKRPADKATDHEFCRRVFIDLIGRIPSIEEVVDFERDKSSDKRVKLVRRLMHDSDYQPKNLNGVPAFSEYLDGNGKKQKEALKFNYKQEYADHWAEIWTVWLMSRSGHQTYRDQMRVWLEEKFAKDTNHKEIVTRLLTATGQVGGGLPTTEKGWTFKESYAANFLVHHLGDPVKDDKDSGDVNEKIEDGAFDAVPITSRSTKLFLGLQTQCVQCHDHPFNKEWVQKDYWGVNAFFRQTVRSATPSGPPVGNNAKMANATSVTLTDDPSLNPKMIVKYDKRNGARDGTFPVMLKDYDAALNGLKSTKMLAGTPEGGKTRRAQLAEWMTTHDNFGKAYANRMWAHFFGRGLNKEPSADDFGSNNEIVHPELLQYLGDEFVKYGHNQKALMEWICTSDAYSLSHVAKKEYSDMKYEPYFARMPLKAMSPEVLFESLMTATSPRKLTPAAKNARMDARDAWMRKLVRQFGDDEGNELSFNGTIVQALLMMNGAELNNEIGTGRGAAQQNIVRDLLGKNGAAPVRMYDDLFLLTLSRHPTPAEVARLEEVRAGKAAVSLGPPTAAPKGKGPAPKGGGPVAYASGAAPGDENFYRDVLWALLNTNEFMINH
ncbi:DUF1549 domain-containing protein [Urbifossiella limnaea]|uniref:DUF1549 domain-containing protein n=1 Tax=Urbifossiella limnaea TaxID=2528023 RepID=A0A517XX90_9BACT|nr:DUF1549 domain-containing protein [Urbifossiella limnaea]QDU22094.1 hypothetical protein ETAA1_40690 [Urbifossiella limnaea]